MHDASFDTHIIMYRKYRNFDKNKKYFIYFVFARSQKYEKKERASPVLYRRMILWTTHQCTILREQSLIQDALVRQDSSCFSV